MSEKLKIPGFMGCFSEVQIFEETPGKESSNSESQDIDLVAMARWCQNYLANNPLPEHDWQCRKTKSSVSEVNRFSFWGLHMPIFEPWPYMGREIPKLGLIDPIVEGDTDSRMDYAYIYMR